MQDTIETQKQEEAQNKIGFGMDNLMQLIEEPFPQFRISQRFKDINQEKLFQIWIQPLILQSGKLYFMELIIMSLILILTQTIKYAQLGWIYPDYKWVMMCIGLGVSLTLIHFQLSKKSLKISLHFSNIATLLLTITSVEIDLITYNIAQDGGGCAALIALITQLSILSYNQLHVLITYCLQCTYIVVRLKFTGLPNPVYIRFLMFIIASHLLIYIFARFFNQRERNQFKIIQQQKNTIKLFQNLVKVFHDGIIITSGDQLIFYNRTVENIFDLSQNTTTNNDLEIGLKNGPINGINTTQLIHCSPFIEKKSLIIESLQKTVLKGSTEQQEQEKSQIRDQESFIKDENRLEQTIWDLIQIQYKNNQLNDLDLMNGLPFTYRSPIGSEKKKLQVYSTIIESSNTKIVLTAIRDMSHWIELQKQKTMSSLKTIAFASAAHEFRNPLNAIIASLNLLEKPSSQYDQEIYLKTAQNCSKLMLNLVKDILDFSQLEAKSLVLNYSNVNLIEIIQECISIFKINAERKGIDLQLKNPNLFPRSIFIDGGRVQQILINLISNAVKYTEAGHVTVSGKLHYDCNQFKIKVEDTGVGVDVSEQDKLFQCFKKIMHHRSLNKDGVGLGLSLSKNMARALGGDIEFKASKNKGAKFYLILPFTEQSMHFRRSSKGLQRYSQQESSYNGELSILEEQEVLFQYSQTKRNEHFVSVTKGLSLIRNQNNDPIIELADNDLSPITLTFPQEFQSCGLCKCSRILIVDDEQFNLIIMKGLLSQYDIDKVDMAYNGRDGLKKVEENFKARNCINHKHYRLIILDNQMPFVNGINAAKKIRLMQEQGDFDQNCKLALISGDENLLRESSYQEVFDYILLKPIDINQLENLLKQCDLL